MHKPGDGEYLRIYLNGVQEGGDLLYTASPNLDTTDLHSMIGPIGVEGAVTIDEFSVFSYAKDASEIQTLIHQKLSGDEVDLVAYVFF